MDNMKHLINVLILILLICSCQSNNHSEIEGEKIKSSEGFIQDTLKYMIKNSCTSAFPKVYIYAIRLIKLNRSTIINIEPVYYNNYLEEAGYPVDYYDYKGSFFLVYCGVEAVKRFDSSYKIKVKNKFNAVCLQYGVGTRKGIVHDDPQLFFKIQNNSLVNYSKGNEKEFYKTFFELDEVKPFLKQE